MTYQKELEPSLRERILKAASLLEESGAVPTHHICKHLIEELRPQIHYGMISKVSIYKILPDKYKTTPKVKALERRQRIKIENNQDRIIKHIRRIDDPIVLNMILKVVKKKKNDIRE